MNMKDTIIQWLQGYKELTNCRGVVLGVSGGKDSTVLLHIARELYPNIKALYVDTGLEYP